MNVYRITRLIPCLMKGVLKFKSNPNCNCVMRK